MKDSLLLLLCVALSLLFTFCGKKWDHSSSPDQHINTLFENKEYNKAISEIFKVLDSLSTKTENDSTIKQSGKLLYRLYDAATASKQYERIIKKLESLQVKPLFKANHLSSISAIKANLYQMSGDNEKAIKLADEYNTQAAPADKAHQIQSLEMISGVYYYCSNNPIQAIKILEKAVDLYRKGTKYKSIGRVLSRLSVYYRGIGKYEKSVDANLEAIKTCQKDSTNQTIAFAYGELSNTYFLLNMKDEAMKMNDKAIGYALKDSFGLSDLYRFKSNMYYQNNQWDSALYYLHKGKEVANARKSFKSVFFMEVERINILLEYPDSVKKALDLAEALTSDSENVPEWLRQLMNLYMGKALIMNNQPNKGLAMLEKVYINFRNMKMTEQEIQALDVLMREYSKRGMGNQLLKEYNHYQLLKDSMNNDEKLRIVAAENTKFETERKKKEIEMLSSQIMLKNKTLYYNIVLITSLSLLLLAALMYIMARRRAHRILLESNKHNLERVLMRQQELNKKNEQLSNELKKALENNNTETVLNLSNQHLLSKEDEQEFRQSFNMLYPKYIKSLREVYPMLTRTEELLAMLIALNYSSEEIALIMGINRTSVNITRSRMRKKMELGKTDSLDEALIKFK